MGVTKGKGGICRRGFPWGEPGVARPVCKFICRAQLRTSLCDFWAGAFFSFPSCILAKGRACKVSFKLFVCTVAVEHKPGHWQQQGCCLWLSHSAWASGGLFLHQQIKWEQRTAGSKQLKISSVICREGLCSLSDPGCRRSKRRSIDLMSGLAFHKRRAVALSNRWLLVPIAEAAVSAAVGSAGRGSRITCGGKVQPWRSALARPARLGGAAAARASPMRAGGPSGGLPALEDGLL